MMKKIFSALLTIGSITAGAQAQNFEGQALQTAASPQGVSALLPSETSTSEARDYALSFSEAAPRRHYQYRSTSASAYAGTLELGFVSAPIAMDVSSSSVLSARSLAPRSISVVAWASMVISLVPIGMPSGCSPSS